jgi:hypothetical protein
MLKLFASGGSLAHIAAGAWTLMIAAFHTEPVAWVAAGMHALGPGLLGLAVTVAGCMLTKPPDVLSLDQDV